MSKAATEAKAEAEAKAKAEAEVKVAAEKATAEEAAPEKAADAKAVILANIRQCVCVSSKSTVHFLEMESIDMETMLKPFFLVENASSLAWFCRQNRANLCASSVLHRSSSCSEADSLHNSESEKQSKIARFARTPQNY